MALAAGHSSLGKRILDLASCASSAPQDVYVAEISALLFLSTSQLYELWFMLLNPGFQEG